MRKYYLTSESPSFKGIIGPVLKLVLHPAPTTHSYSLRRVRSRVSALLSPFLTATIHDQVGKQGRATLDLLSLAPCTNFEEEVHIPPIFTIYRLGSRARPGPRN